jgi:hypothetical protein
VIGSGNVTSAGWHHNAEIWTVLAASATEWPDTFVDLAAWLRRLPDVLYMDPFGASRIRDVAALLVAHPERATGPQLAHNLDRPIVAAVPDLSGRGGTDEFGVASPFLDGAASALRELTRRLSPATATLALTTKAVGPAHAVTRWASAGRLIAAIEVPPRQAGRVAPRRHPYGPDRQRERHRRRAAPPRRRTVRQLRAWSHARRCGLPDAIVEDRAHR